jgi:PHD/YefM family antitoxin component YafN of YafNO toxin-antitoxin module
MTLNESFVVDAKGRKVSVLLPIKDYQKLLEELEELEDIKAYDKATNRKQEFIPLDKALKEIEAGRKKKK